MTQPAERDLMPAQPPDRGPAPTASAPRNCAVQGAFVIGLCLTAVVVPLVYEEAIPFSMFPMYATRPAFINLVEIEDDAGQRIDPALYGLQIELHPWAPRHSGMPLPPSENPFVRLLTMDDVVKRIEDKPVPSQAPARVKLTVFGARSDGSFGLLSEESRELDEGER